MAPQKLLTVKVEIPEKVQEQAIKIAWLDGARSGAATALLAGLLLGYLLWRK